jgi:hypothetical protein
MQKLQTKSNPDYASMNASISNDKAGKSTISVDLALFKTITEKTLVNLKQLSLK